MKEENKKEELQSRRQFFKSAAKAALPILGAVVLANVPTISNATSSCTGTCHGYCVGSCVNGCKNDSCKHSCRSTCRGGNKYT